MSYRSSITTLAAAGAVMALPLAAQQERPTFSTAVAMVRLHVAVLDRHGNPIDGLGPADFEIHEQGLRQRPAYVFRPEDTPVEAAVVLDLSGSMRDSLDDAYRAVSELASALRDTDCLIVVPFAEKVAATPWIPGGGSVPPFNETAIGSRRETALFDAILVAQLALTARRADALASELGMAKVSDIADSCLWARLDPAATYRQLLVIVSDGLDSVSGTGWSAVMSNALELAIPTVSVFAGRNPDGDSSGGSDPGIWPSLRANVRQTPDSGLAVWLRLSMERMHALAAASGGLFEELRSDSYPALFRRVLTLLRGTYVVTFPRTAASTGSSDAWRQVSVSVPEYDAVVFAPGGYYVEASSSSRARVASEVVYTLAKSGNLDEAAALLEDSTRQVPDSWEAQSLMSHVRELQQRLMAPRVFLQPTISTTVESFLLVRHVDAMMARIVSDAPMLGLVTNPALARYRLWFDVDSSGDGSGPLMGRLRVNDPADPIRPLPPWSREPDTPLGRLRFRSRESWRLEIPSADSEAQLRETLAPVFAQLSQWLQRREDERQR